LSNQKQVTLTPEQEQQQLFSKLSAQYKTPLRNILGEAEEAVQNTISNMIQQMIGLHNALKNSNQEKERLQKLCVDNKINIHPTPPNRAERRSQERKADKKEKLGSK